jgi:1,6-anhydro-N-acetylmuramate kinase
MPMSARLTRVIGLMSGLALDGIDVAVTDTDGERRVVARPGHLAR